MQIQIDLHCKTKLNAVLYAAPIPVKIPMLNQFCKLTKAKIKHSVADPGISKPGGAVPCAVEFVGSGVCFDAPSHITYVL